MRHSVGSCANEIADAPTERAASRRRTLTVPRVTAHLQKRRGYARSGGPAPRDEVIQHRVHRLLLARAGLERGEALEIVIEGQRDLRPHVGDLDLAHHQSKLLDGARSADGAVADESGGLVVPFAKEKVDRVLERAGRRMVVLGGDEDERVEGRDLRGPGLRVRLRVLVHRGRHRLVQERQIEGRDVDNLERRVVPLRSDVVDPARDGLGLATGTGAADDDRYVQHLASPRRFWSSHLGPRVRSSRRL